MSCDSLSRWKKILLLKVTMISSDRHIKLRDIRTTATASDWIIMNLGAVRRQRKSYNDAKATNRKQLLVTIPYPYFMKSRLPLR